jgi:primosomal protein N' (replication factor Y) (superfamily II helicase)
VTPSPSIAKVALPLALPGPLLYAVPAELADSIRPGHRVKVPLRGRHVHGFVVELTDEATRASLRPIAALDPPEPLLDLPLLELVRWVAHYYAAPIGITFESAVPRAVARPPRAAEEAAGPAGVGAAALVPNPAQSVALARIVESLEKRETATFLLQGVTGSGKTEVYLQAAEIALRAGRGVLVLVPEIALGTQLVARVRARFGPLVVEYHSQLAPAARRRAWWRARRGEARVVVGARSAVFVPIADLGLIVVDEEHEPAYKQGETPRYHGRDTALMRARRAGAVTVLGSATPSLETRTHAAAGKYAHLSLPERVESRPAPRVRSVDLRREPLETGEPLSTDLRDRLRAVVAEGDQAILFLNRRGFSTAVQCRDCGHLFECPRCSVVLTFHRPEGRLLCHYCNHTVRDLTRCPKCDGSDFAFGGVGTQRVEASLATHLPGARVLRMDLDSTRRRGTSAEMIRAFERHEADILLGTQMVAKGFDFPRVTLVGVIQADREIGLPDFRAPERAFQLLTQVAGRAGRGEKPGEVIFQTYMPEHHVIAAASEHDYESFYAHEMEDRRGLRYPPWRRMANLLFDGPDEAAVIRCATAEGERLTGRKGIEVLGPAPMPLSRLKNQYRWHLTMLSGQPSLLTAALHETLELAHAAKAGRVRVQADMDPVSML